MLQNLNNNVCVSHIKNSYQDLWICYTQSNINTLSKRQAWKRVSGMLSTPEMCDYLEKNYSNSEVKQQFSVLSDHI